MTVVEAEVFDTPDRLASAAAQFLHGCIARIIEEKGECVMAVAGGKTPSQTYRYLGCSHLPWDRVIVFQTDERVGQPGPHFPGAAAIAEALLQRAPIPRANWHPMPGAGSGGLEDAARAYSAELLALRPAGTPDVVVLGLGDDGHTASIFPWSVTALETKAPAAITDHSSGVASMTLTLAALAGATWRVLLASGSTKSLAVANIIAGRPAPSAAMHILRRGGRLMVDQEAAALLTEPGAGTATVSRQ